jgi:hypothetical protein
MGEMNRGIDPTLDAAGALGDECFLCGRHYCNSTFGPKSVINGQIVLMPQIAVHTSCIARYTCVDPTGKPGISPYVISEYNRRVADTVGLRRYVT